MKDNWFCYSNKITLLEELAQEILNLAKKSIFEKGFFSVVITGGQSILGLYKILSKAKSNFNKWHIYISDERFLPKNHRGRNDTAINKIWLNNNQIPKKNIHFIQAELGLEKARNDYAHKLDKVSLFDLVLLSVGEDGHISSLFPKRKYAKNQSVIIERNSPKPPKERISISLGKLNHSKNLFKVIIGQSKWPIVKKLLKGDQLVANSVKSEMEKVFIYTSNK